MSIRESVYGMKPAQTPPMRKQAIFGDLLPSFSDIHRLAADVLATSSSYLLAAAMGVGGTAGYLGAKMTAHGDRDIDTARKSYDNQRLRADLGYLSGKVRQEFDAQQRQQAPKPARVIA